METFDPTRVTGLILAGGRGSRMGEVNKGLQMLGNAPLISHVIQRLSPQVGSIVINANRDITDYAAYNYPVISDQFEGYAGPLAGIHAGLLACQSPYLLTCPCDSPLIPPDLASRLTRALEENQAQLAVVACEDMESEDHAFRAQPVFSLMHRDLAPHLQRFLAQGGRKISLWYASLRVTEVVFDDANAFQNINTRAQLDTLATMMHEL